MSIILIAAIVIVIVIVAAIYLSNDKGPTQQEADLQSGSTNANQPTVGYKHPCKFCGKLIPPNSVA